MPTLRYILVYERPVYKNIKHRPLLQFVTASPSIAKSHTNMQFQS